MMTNAMEQNMQNTDSVPSLIDFPSWENMSDLEQARCIYWDMYKDAYGFRPRGIDTSAWTVEDFQKVFVALEAVIDSVEQDRVAAEQQAVERFEVRIARTMDLGAHDREMALRWIHEADDTAGDEEYLCFKNGLPYGYFKQRAAQCG